MIVKEGASLPTSQKAGILFFKESNPLNTFTISKPKDAETQNSFPAKAEEAKRTEYSRQSNASKGLK